MALQCEKCNQEIIKRDFLKCCACLKHYHLDCTSISEQFFYLMSVDSKNKYKCEICTHSEDWTRNNVTIRKPKINIPIENSFDGLSLEDDDDMYQSFATGLSSVKSWPDLNAERLKRVHEMEELLSKLKEKLEIAEEEITNLLEENKNLKKEILSKKLHPVTGSCTTITPTSTKSTKRKNRSHRQKKKLNFTNESQTPNTRKRKENTIFLSEKCTAQMSTPTQIPATTQLLEAENTEMCTNQNTNSNYSSTVVPSKSQGSKSLRTPGCEQSIGKKANIFIVGDQQVRGLAGRLSSARSGKWNDQYNVTGIVKPNATSTDILRSAHSLAGIVTKDDIIIISVGSNDKNPYVLFSNLCNVLFHLKQCTIILLNVCQNCYLNVDTINDNMKLFAKQYKNCKFIDIQRCDNEAVKFYNMSKLNYIVFKLNIEINYLRYDHDYIVKDPIMSNERKSFFRK